MGDGKVTIGVKIVTILLGGLIFASIIYISHKAITVFIDHK